MNKELDPRSVKGLSAAEAAANLKRYGYNELPSAKKRSIFAIAFEVVREPMFLLLVACGILYLILGDIQEALMLLGFVFVVMGITFYQERKTERALEALRDLTSPRALVIRGGERIRIAGREVVPGDCVLLSEGDRIPADGVIIWDNNLSVDESLLTGESVPVRKTADAESRSSARPGGDGTPFVFSGTMAVQGQAIALIKSTGEGTEIGRIGRSLIKVEQEDTLLQKDIRVLVKQVAFLGVTMCVILLVVYGLTRGDWIKGFLAGLSLAMAVLPEEFPVVLTIFFALGAWRISKKRVLTRRVPVIETLGSAAVLCVDKTGTLTMNMMAVSEVYTGGKYYMVGRDARTVDPAIEDVIEYGILSCQKDPFDPMEKAFKSLSDRISAPKKMLHETHEYIKEYPLSKKMLALSHVWQDKGSGACVVACKGAPEAVIDLCHMPPAGKDEVLNRVNEMAGHGLRVLGVARASFGRHELPGDQHDFKFEFLGLVGLADPVRPGVKEAINECYEAGIRVVMITGDYPATAKNIALEIGLKNPEEAVTGPEIDELQPDKLMQKASAVNVFARVVPEQKLKLVEAFKSLGLVTAMTGDGVNDAPALKAANIGIAMGGRGTDVARESSSLVLLDDDFNSIVAAVRMGRRIFDNIKKALAYIVSVHIPIAGLSLLPVFLKWPLILMPVHIVFLELIIDPACSTVFESEPEEKDVMKRRPRGRTDRVFGPGSIMLSAMQGVVVLGVILAVYVFSGKTVAAENDARAMAFATLVVSNLCLIITNLSWTRSALSVLRDPNPAMWWVLGGAFSLLAAVLYVPFLRGLFRFGVLHPDDIAFCFAAGLFSILWFEVVKAVRAGKNYKLL